MNQTSDVALSNTRKEKTTRKEELLEFCKKSSNIMQHLPDENRFKKLRRKTLITVIYVKT
jgi:hypothetical protein